jgi:protein-S-isoprenylcysteine O-methyltransferase Ste14
MLSSPSIPIHNHVNHPNFFGRLLCYLSMSLLNHMWINVSVVGDWAVLLKDVQVNKCVLWNLNFHDLQGMYLCYTP